MAAKAKSKKNKLVGFLLPVAVFAVAAAVLMLRSTGAPESRGGNPGSGRLNEQGDLVIPLEEVTETAVFYPVEAGGVEMEILAVRATDGTVRTAFNTCQICYNSGRGYYQQEGEYLVCQNCGNRFHTDDVEIVRGGCNPVPITNGYKSTSEESITVSEDFLEAASVIFTNWR